MDRELQRVILDVIRAQGGETSAPILRQEVVKIHWKVAEPTGQQQKLFLHQLSLLQNEEKILKDQRTANLYYVLSPAGYGVFDAWYKRFWFEFKHNSAPYIGIISLLASIVTIWFVYSQAKETGRQADLLQQQISLSVQPFLVLTHGNEGATAVMFKNVGSGVAKDVYVLKHASKDAPDLYSVTPEGSVGIAIPAGEERNLNLNSQSMTTTNRAELISAIPCLANVSLLSDPSSWVAVFYKDLYGNNFASVTRGTQSPYDKAVEFLTFECKQ